MRHISLSMIIVSSVLLFSFHMDPAFSGYCTVHGADADATTSSATTDSPRTSALPLSSGVPIINTKNTISFFAIPRYSHGNIYVTNLDSYADDLSKTLNDACVSIGAPPVADGSDDGSTPNIVLEPNPEINAWYGTPVELGGGKWLDALEKVLLIKKAQPNQP